MLVMHWCATGYMHLVTHLLLSAWLNAQEAPRSTSDLHTEPSPMSAQIQCCKILQSKITPADLGAPIQAHLQDQRFIAPALYSRLGGAH